MDRKPYYKQRGRQGDGGLNLQLFLSGLRSLLTVTVRMFRGNVPAVGESVRLFIGTTENPFKAIIKNAEGNDWTVQIGPSGIGSTKMDLTSFLQKDFTHLTASVQNRTISTAIPGEEVIPGKIAFEPRGALRVAPSEEEIVSSSNRYTLTVFTSKSGKPASKGLCLISNHDIRLMNRTTNEVLLTKGTTCALNTNSEGWIAINIATTTLATSVTIYDPENGEQVSRKLIYSR
jgi:hypothetical protein